jgi:hypothetical protein
MILFLALACSHTQAVWEHTPPPSTSAPTTELSVVISDRRCQMVADSLAVALSMREGVRVVPHARTRLLLNLCRVDVQTEVDISQMYPGSDGISALDRREQIIRGEGKAVLTVELDGRPIDMLNTEGHRVRMIREGDPAHLHRRSAVHDSVVRDLSEDLVQQLVPIAETIRRRWYRNPDPGTARALHNQAVDAERSGDLSAAIQLAQAAVNASRTPQTVGYLQDLTQRHSSFEYVEREDGSPRPD